MIISAIVYKARRRSTFERRLTSSFIAVLMSICGMLFSLNVAGQELDSIGSRHPQGSTHTIMDRLQQVQLYLDSAAMKKVDPRYIEVPAKPWRVILRYNANAVDVDYDNTLTTDQPGDNSYWNWNLNFDPPTATSIGFWVGYRGTGVSFSKSLTKNDGRYFSISSTGTKYGFNFRHKRFRTSAITFSSKAYIEGKGEQVDMLQGDMPSPVWVRSTYINGYYVFNGRRYSQAAAYNQSVIQRRSAGSLLVGATWYQSSFDYSDVENSIFMEFAKGLGHIKVHQANIGVGYGYNFVPFRGLVINAMAMPTLSVYNRVKVYKYDSNYVIPLSEAAGDDFGAWNSERKTWANGETHKPLPIFDNMEEYPADAERWETGSEIEYSWMLFNFDLRLGIAYNWKDFFIGLQAQYNKFTYKKDQSKVNIYDVYARIALGVRL